MHVNAYPECTKNALKSPPACFTTTVPALKLIHTATPDTTKLSCLCRVRIGGVNCTPDNSRLSPTENLKSGVNKRV